MSYTIFGGCSLPKFPETGRFPFSLPATPNVLHGYPDFWVLEIWAIPFLPPTAYNSVNSQCALSSRTLVTPNNHGSRPLDPGPFRWFVWCVTEIRFSSSRFRRKAMLAVDIGRTLPLGISHTCVSFFSRGTPENEVGFGFHPRNPPKTSTAPKANQQAPVCCTCSKGQMSNFALAELSQTEPRDEEKRSCNTSQPPSRRNSALATRGNV